MASVSCRIRAESPSSNRRASINARDPRAPDPPARVAACAPGDRAPSVPQLRYAVKNKKRTWISPGTLGRVEAVTWLDRFRARPYLRCALGTHLYRVLTSNQIDPIGQRLKPPSK